MINKLTADRRNRSVRKRCKVDDSYSNKRRLKYSNSIFLDPVAGSCFPWMYPKATANHSAFPLFQMPSVGCDL
jgi:hypothetical protein